MNELGDTCSRALHPRARGVYYYTTTGYIEIQMTVMRTG